MPRGLPRGSYLFCAISVLVGAIDHTAMMDDSSLLRRYAENRSEGDFAELVRRHLNLVYSAALRQVNGDTHLAQDVTQLVFTDLARKAAQLADHRVLAGWLFTSTRFAAAKLVRGEQRRRTREQEAELMQESDSTAPLAWERVRPVLDEALAELNEQDREAILLRYLEGQDFASVGAKLALTDNAARMRVDRAMDKLRGLLARRGVTSTAAALSLALANQAIVAAPAGLAASVTGMALAGASTAATVTFMTLTKLQLSLASAVVVTGAGVFAVQEQTNSALRDELAGVQQNSAEIASLRQDNRTLEQAAGRVADLKVSDTELVRLRDEAVALQRQLQTAAQPAPPVRTQPRSSASSAAGPSWPLKELDSMPKATRRPAPAYPADLRAAEIGGSVVVSFVIDATGKVQDAKAVKSTHHGFEEAAIAAVKEWQFEPGRKGGRMVNTRVTQLLEFDAGKGNQTASDWF
jgi:RNA polymerase sigma factor (sigma-70 family)